MSLSINQQKEVFILKKCAVINDLSGFGKCSLAVSLPIISVMGSEVHPLPTAVLSNQTAYDSYKSYSLTSAMPEFINEWRKLDCSFDAIMTGYFCDALQIKTAIDFVDEFKGDNTIVVVDPVMADNGALYDGCTREMCECMKQLCSMATVITPNISELAILADMPLCNTYEDIEASAVKLINSGIENVVVTGYKADGRISNFIFNSNEAKALSAEDKGGYYSGTGDIFTSVVTGALLRGQSLDEAVELAVCFIEKAVSQTNTSNHNNGIDFEFFLKELI